jgi:hypothetical protein
MESKNHKIIKNFINQNEVDEILSWVDTLSTTELTANHHLREITKVLNGNSFMFDISQTKETTYITNFQKRDYVRTEGVPDFIIKLIDRISETIGIPKNHLFLQAVNMQRGGKIAAHYDASLDGLINYKCNLSVLSEDYSLFTDQFEIPVQQFDLYCFEASLYKHWTNEFKSRRVFLSFGFLVPYSFTNRSKEDPRVRLSERIQKYFQNI